MKTTNDLFAMMTDAYEVTSDQRMVLKEKRNGVPPTVKLDGMYKYAARTNRTREFVDDACAPAAWHVLRGRFVDAMSTLVPNGAPSLLNCDKLTIEGSVSPCVHLARHLAWHLARHLDSPFHSPPFLLRISRAFRFASVPG